MTVVAEALHNTWRSDVLAEEMAGVCGESEVAVNKRHERERLFQTLELGFLSQQVHFKV